MFIKILSYYIVYKIYIIPEHMTLACKIMLRGEGGSQSFCTACYTVLYSDTYCITHHTVWPGVARSHNVIRIMYLSSGPLAMC
jgi:hypothetical protein